MPPGASAGAQRQFKRHKVLPRPPAEKVRSTVPREAAPAYDLVLDTANLTGSSSSSSGSQASSPRTLKHQNKRIGVGPDLPPTPPAHSRNPSSTHAPLPPNPTAADPVHTPKATQNRPPATPPDQRSPPTPDVTPPQPAIRPRPRLFVPGEQSTSRTTPAESRTESFKTAREEPFSSEDEDGKSTVRLAPDSASTSQSTVRRHFDAGRSHVLQPQALGLALARLNPPAEESFTPRTKKEFGQFDGDWASSSDVEQEWDYNLERAVTVKKRLQEPSTPRTKGRVQDGIVEDRTVNPTSSTKTVRRMPLRDQVGSDSSPNGSSHRGPESSNPSTSETSVSMDARRSSGNSVKSARSKVVGAVLVAGPPQRQRTLRHVKKQTGLRQSLESSPNSTVKSFESATPSRPIRSNTHPEHFHHESIVSTRTNNSMSSGRARREVWKNGGIPVIVVPDRKSSTRSKSSREPSLRSTSSKRSKRTMSVGSSSLDGAVGKDVPPLSGHNVRRGRAYSESDGANVRTLDFPPSIPTRSSSLSAPTSRNNSRAGSMTAESVQTRNALQYEAPQQDQPTLQLLEKGPQLEPAVQSVAQPSPHFIVEPPVDAVDESTPTRATQQTESSALEKDDAHDRFSIDHHDDAHSSRKYSSRNTPFSAASIETNGTAPEVSEAFAVHMYPHQNSSLLMVNHSNKPSDGSDVALIHPPAQALHPQPKITASAPDGEVPVTPPQPQLPLEDVDSPLRNPRAPPEPPSHPPLINFIPATPSGYTPAVDKGVHMGNYFEATGSRPPHRLSLVRRALSRRRHSMEYPPSSSKPPGLLTRTFSLSRNTRRVPEGNRKESSNPDREGRPTYPQEEDPPAEGDKLHPFWRPQWDDGDEDSCGSQCDHEEEEVYRYPRIDNRPRLPQRSLSAKMKHTFAIFPAQGNGYYYADDSYGTERRTIRRTPSGSLRVMRRRNSTESLRKMRDRQRPSTAPDGQTRRGFWRGNSVSRGPSQESPRRSSIGSAFEGIQSIPRRVSEKRREKRTQELRKKISGPREVRDGVEEMARSSNAGTQYRAYRQV